MPKRKSRKRKTTVRGRYAIAKPRGRKTTLKIFLTSEERRELLRLQRSQFIPSGIAKRSRIILLMADGEAISHIALIVGIGRRFVYMWINRFLEAGEDRVAGLSDKVGRGRKARPKSASNDQKERGEEP